MTFFGF